MAPGRQISPGVDTFGRRSCGSGDQTACWTTRAEPKSLVGMVGGRQGMAAPNRRQFRMDSLAGDRSSHVSLKRLQGVQDADWSGHFAKPATRLMDAEMMTAPSGKDSQAWYKAIRRICLDSMLVSETWNVMPIVKDR